VEPNKHILYLSYDGLTDPLGGSQILPYLIGLSKLGYRFTIISAEKKELYENGCEEVAAICQQHQMNWRPIFYHKKPAVLSTLFDLWLLYKNAKQIHRTDPVLGVHCRSYITSIVGLKMKRSLGIKFIFDMRGFWADERIDGQIWNLKNPIYRWIYRYFKRLEKQFLLQSDAVVSLTHIGKSIIHDQWQIKRSVSVIPCAVDTEHFTPIDKKTSNLKPLTIGYLGSIGTWYMLDEMLDFFKVLLKTYPEAKFKFITREKPEYILQKVRERHIATSQIEIAPAKRTEVPLALSEIDLGMFFIKTAFSKQASSPVKQGEFMSMGIPIITNSGIGDTDQIVNTYQSGLIISNFTEADYLKVIDQIPELLKTDRNHITEGAQQYFSLSQGIEQYKALYKSIL